MSGLSVSTRAPIERLRASRKQYEEALVRRGEEAGRNWADNVAEYIELKRLRSKWEEIAGEGGSRSDWLTIPGGDETEAWLIFQASVRSDEELEVSFWREVTESRDSDDGLFDPLFVHAFANAALDTWSQMENAICE